jgi:hypothetical protein
MTVLCAFENRKFAEPEKESRITRNMMFRMEVDDFTSELCT